MQNETKHMIEGAEITVKTEKISLCPLAFKIRAEHPDGISSHETSLTIGDADLRSIATLEEAQKHLDSARASAAVMASKKAALLTLASQLQ